jgi:hypothetical protein
MCVTEVGHHARLLRSSVFRGLYGPFSGPLVRANSVRSRRTLGRPSLMVSTVKMPPPTAIRSRESDETIPPLAGGGSPHTAAEC